LPELEGSLTGQTAMVTGEEDICAAAKILKSFHAEFQKPVVRGGVLDNSALTAGQVAELADLPSKAALQSKLLGLLQTPATQFVRVLNEPGASLARVLKAKADAAGEAAKKFCPVFSKPHRTNNTKQNRFLVGRTAVRLKCPEASGRDDTTIEIIQWQTHKHS